MRTPCGDQNQTSGQPVARIESDVERVAKLNFVHFRRGFHSSVIHLTRKLQGKFSPSKLLGRLGRRKVSLHTRVHP